ncbi:MAG: hypothetical protein ACOYCA_05620, partial [Eggerthellaceae bacterium]
CNDSGVFSVIQNQWLGTVLDLTSVKLGSGATDLKASDLKGTVIESVIANSAGSAPTNNASENAGSNAVSADEAQQ